MRAAGKKRRGPSTSRLRVNKLGPYKGSGVRTTQTAKLLRGELRGEAGGDAVLVGFEEVIFC